MKRKKNNWIEQKQKIKKKKKHFEMLSSASSPIRVALMVNSKYTVQ